MIIQSTNSNMPAPVPAPQPIQMQKGSQPNLVSASGAHHENWGEANMADSSSRTDTSTDGDGEDKNQLVMRFTRHQNFLLMDLVFLMLLDLSVRSFQSQHKFHCIFKFTP